MMMKASTSMKNSMRRKSVPASPNYSLKLIDAAETEALATTAEPIDSDAETTSTKKEKKSNNVSKHPERSKNVSTPTKSKTSPLCNRKNERLD